MSRIVERLEDSNRSENQVIPINEEERFILETDDGDLVIVTDVEFDFRLLQSRIIPMKGISFGVDYKNGNIEKGSNVDILTSFTIDNICPSGLK